MAAIGIVAISKQRLTPKFRASSKILNHKGIKITTQAMMNKRPKNI